MRPLAIFVLALTLALLSACARNRDDSRSTSPQPATRTESGATTPAAPQDVSTEKSTNSAASNTSTIQDGQMKPASLTNAQNSQGSVVVTERKLIRNADITLESDNPADTLRKVTLIAEGNGGFVVSSESKQANAEGQLKSETTVTIKVPAAQFDSVINQIRGTGSRVTQDKISTQDVTEEYIDLEARIRAKQALEAQFMEIMKQARTVQDALEVQEQLSDVRAEIERYEGRRRFLENQTSLSTINITMRPPTQIVSTTGFFYSVKRAFSDGLDVAAAITLGLIQVVVALLPVLIFIGLPIFLIVRYFVRRAQRQPPRVTAPPPATTT